MEQMITIDIVSVPLRIDNSDPPFIVVEIGTCGTFIKRLYSPTFRVLRPAELPFRSYSSQWLRFSPLPAACPLWIRVRNRGLFYDDL